MSWTSEENAFSPDPHSFARPLEARVTHLQWNAQVDFATNTISATARWTIVAATGAKEIVLDTRSMNIESVWRDELPTDFTTGPEDLLLGRWIKIPITEKTNSVTLQYKTDPQAEALQWLTPAQTAGKKLPFLFTQSQAILARTWIPCQDSPGIRFTYSADILVPHTLLALMSASNPQQRTGDGRYHFEMKHPIPSYLLALAVGDVVFRPVSDRTGIYAEANMIDSAIWEFDDLENMVQSAEALYGDYPWERYDLLVLPPSFPFGGMENPRLTFVTPTVITGDRSLTSLIAHELAHSWSGNLVTNATWNDFWLNEGFTVYFEMRIMEKLYGADYAAMLISLNLGDLLSEIGSLQREDKAADTKLKLDLAGRNPDEGVTEIAYIKGFFFLRTFDVLYGREKFDAFLRFYFKANAFGSMSTENFIPLIRNFYDEQYGIAISEDHFDGWIYSEGIPAPIRDVSSKRFDTVDEVAAYWKTTGNLDASVVKSWSTHEKLRFILQLPLSLTTLQMEMIDAVFGFTQAGNAEITSLWGVLAIRHGYTPMYPVIEQFLLHTGRRKFLMPLYREMMAYPSGMEWARKIYGEARFNYHFVATASIDALLEETQQT